MTRVELLPVHRITELRTKLRPVQPLLGDAHGPWTGRLLMLPTAEQVRGDTNRRHERPACLQIPPEIYSRYLQSRRRSNMTSSHTLHGLHEDDL